MSLRGLRRRPGMPLFAVATLGLGVAGTLSVYTVVRGVLLRELPYPAPERLALIWRGTDDEPDLRGALSPPDWVDVRIRARSTEDVAAVNSFRTTYQPEAGTPEAVDLGVVTGNFFEVLGVGPRLGRAIVPDDDRPAGGDDGLPAVVLSHDFWERRLGGDPAAVGRTVHFGGTEHLVVGVMDEDFRLLMPAGAGMETDVQGWTPLRLPYGEQPRDGFYLKVLARLAPGVSRGQAEAELEGLAAALRSEHPEHRDAGLRLRVAPLHDEVVAHVRPYLVVLALVGGGLLVVTAANVGALLLVRSLGRRNAAAVRRALGASRSRLVLSSLAESAVVVGSGTGLGLLLVRPVVDGLLALQPGLVPRTGAVTVDGGVLVAAVGLAAALTLVCGVAPAVLGSTEDAPSLLRSRSGGRGRAGRRLHQALVVAQVVASFLLLYGTGSLLADLARAHASDAGYREAGVLTFRVSLPFEAYPDPSSWVDFFQRLEARLEGRPDVVLASATTGLPTDVGDGPEPWAPVRASPDEPWGARRALHVVVTPGHFETLGIPLRAGRVLAPSDGPDDVPVAVVDEVLAGQLGAGSLGAAGPGGAVLDRRIEVTRHEFEDGYRVARVTARIVGVVGTVPHGHPEAEPPGTIYLAQAQYPLWAMSVAVRGPSESLPSAPGIRGTLAAVDPSVPAVAVRPLRDVAAATLAPTRFVLALLGVLATLVVALTVAGLYGVISETVRQRGRELGVRMALGATASRVTAGVLGSGLILAGLGLAPGLLLAPGLGGRLREALGHGTTLSGSALAGAAVLVAAIAALASWLPARRAGRIDPVRVLRAE